MRVRQSAPIVAPVTAEEDQMTNTSQAHDNRHTSADEDLAFAGVSRLGELLDTGQVTPRELAEFYLARIERLDPALRAFISVRAEPALAEADAALSRLRAGEQGPLLGVPVAVKDIVDVSGEVTTHGAGGERAPATADSEVVRRLRSAGAVILGKTALCELAAYAHFTSSAAHGVTRNPWNRDRSPGGSSGGSAAAVAAGMVPVALGSDGGGSIRIPSAFCGVFGLKPQRGRVSLAPLDGHWHGCTVLGGIGRGVLDVAIFNDAISGGPAAGPARADWLVAAARRHPDRLRIAVSLKPAIPGVKPSPQSVATIEQAAQLLRSLGHVVDTHELDHPQLLTTFTPRWASGIRDDALALGGDLEPRTLRMAALGRRLGGRALRRSLERERGVAERLNTVFDRYDLVMTPVTAAPPPRAEISNTSGAFRTFNQGSPYVCYTPTWNYVGQPAAAIPAGFDHEGLPQAIQLAGPATSEPLIVSLAAQIEDATSWSRERPPSITDIHPQPTQRSNHDE
jgi:amidase